MDSNFSLSDLKAVTDNDSFGGCNSTWIIILFLLIFNGGGVLGARNSELNQFATAASQNEILLGQKFDALSRQVNQVGDGLASSTFALNNSITNEGRAIQTQLAECCCANKEATAQVRYDMANFAASINSNIDNKFAALEKSQLETRLAEQAQQINQLQLAQQLCGIPRVNNTAYGVYPYNSCGTTPCGCAM